MLIMHEKDKPGLRNFEVVMELSYSVVGNFNPKNSQNVDFVSSFLNGFKTVLQSFTIQEQNEKYDLKVRVETCDEFNYQLVSETEMLCSQQMKFLVLLTSNSETHALFQNNEMMPLIFNTLRKIKYNNSQRITEQKLSEYRGPSILRKKIDPEYLVVTVEGFRRPGEGWSGRHPQEKLAQMVTGQR